MGSLYLFYCISHRHQLTIEVFLGAKFYCPYAHVEDTSTFNYGQDARVSSTLLSTPCLYHTFS